ncbi:unnamed protein product, partial [Rotaria sp. Silwood2]
MVQYVTKEEEDRLRLAAPFKAENCRRIIKLLKDRASELLSELVLSSSDKLDEMEDLIELQASCYQEEKYGSLGLLGKLLSQEEKPVRLQVVQLLVENDQDAKFALTKEDDLQRTCLSLSQNNPKSSEDVNNYIQEQMDALLNEIPVTHRLIDVNEAAQWIRRGANPEATDEHQNTVLSNAVRASNVDLVRVLVANGCNTKHTNEANKTPLEIAQDKTPRNPQLIAILSEQAVNHKLKQLIRTKNSRLEKQEIFDCLEEGANINARVNNNDSFLHYLITHKGTPEMVTAFVNDFNADVLATNNEGLRPIELCILYDKESFGTLRTLLKLPRVTTEAFFNDVLKKSIYQFANEKGLHKIADIIQKELNIRLWTCITNANTNDERNQRVLFEAKKLVDYGAQIDQLHNIDEKYKGWGVLHLACKTTTKSFVEYLVRDLKANCTLANSNGDRPISVAAEYGQFEIVQFLRECPDVRLNVSNKKLETPLHLAVKNHHYRIVRYLILWGADDKTQNESKKTPLNSAERSSTKTKEENIERRKIINFLRGLDFHIDSATREENEEPITPILDLDTCDLLTHIDVNKRQRYARNDETKTDNTRLKVLEWEPDSKLHAAIKSGNVAMARRAIRDGDDIFFNQNCKSPYKFAIELNAEYTCKAQVNSTNSNDHRRFCVMALGCQQIADDLFKHIKTQLVESIKQSNYERVVAYCETEIPITSELLHIACTSSDNVDIVRYLVQKNSSIYEAMYNYTTSDSPYCLAKKNKFNNVATYIKYRLSLDCEEAVKKNNVELVRQLIDAGASVDLDNTDNLAEALRHKNAKLIQLICDNGAKLPIEWLQSDCIVLLTTIAEEMDSDIAFIINCNLVNRRLRLAAANGDFQVLRKCQQLGADINAKNCHGSTALLCAVLHGNYRRIVHALISRGASMLHSNENQSESLIELCKKKGYKEIENYLTEQLNIQFSAAVLDDDRQSATAFAALGANFNYQDEQKQTLLHYAIQYHGIDLVSWLCERGSTPTSADANGDYPITLAAKKAKNHHQEEIIDILQFHYDQQLKMDIPSDIELDKIVTLDAKYKKILHGMLEGLNSIITGISVSLDPADPKTFVNLFSKLKSNVRQNSQDIGKVNTNEDIRKLIDRDVADSNEKLAKIEDRLNHLQQYNEMLMKTIRETDERLSTAQ